MHSVHDPASPSAAAIDPPPHEAPPLETAISSARDTPLRESAALDRPGESGGKGARIVLSGAWEQELIISGAVVFALVQLPSLVDAAFHRLDGRVSGAGWSMTMMGYEFAKLILYALISAFVVHLSSRAYWVGLMGLHSVFPNGVQWEKSRAGPIARETYRERFPTLPQSIAAADDFCSVIFSFAFMMVISFFAAVVWCAAALAIVWGISAGAFHGEWQQGVFMAIFMTIAFTPAVLYTLDKRFGERLDPAGLPRRIIRAGIVFFFYASFLRLAGPISQVLFTNLPKRRAYGMMVAIIVALMTLFIVKDLIIGQGGGLGVMASTYLPAEDDPRAMNFEHYEDQRGESSRGVVPSIPSDVVGGPYVRLFIPYIMRRHETAVVDQCPGVKPAPEEGAPDGDAAAGAVLACLSRIQRVWINGKPLTGVGFQFRTDPVTGVRGIVGYIPTAGLPRGENVLTVERAPRSREAVALKVKPGPPYRIRFWV
jgi:hypothetical protein